MTDAALVSKKLAMIERLLGELRRLARPEQIAADVREERFVEHSLQLAIQAALDVASHLVSDQRLGEPRSNRELFELLAKAGLLPPDLSTPLQAMAGFRNVLVHGYDDVDLAIVRDVLERHLVDLDRFVAAVRTRLEEEGAAK
jgi:uncharacterized protein YutE (UPF0331/DUF86 family)